MKIRPQVLVGEIVLGAVAIILALNGEIEGALGCVAVIGATMKELVESG